MRYGLVHKLNLPPSTSFDNAIEYLDCGYIYVGVGRNELENKFSKLGIYTIVPSGAMSREADDFTVHFDEVNITRHYELYEDRLRLIYRPKYGDSDEMVVCPKKTSVK